MSLTNCGFNGFCFVSAACLAMFAACGGSGNANDVVEDVPVVIDVHDMVQTDVVVDARDSVVDDVKPTDVQWTDVSADAPESDIPIPTDIDKPEIVDVQASDIPDVHISDTAVDVESDTSLAECITGPWCVNDIDCPAYEGKHCNTLLDPPQCQLLYCGLPATPCSEDALCASEVCFLDSCCEPDCSGFECGDDGCGGICGECAEDAFCTLGHCCQPDCSRVECGPDPICGSDCGSCAENSACVSGSCEDVTGMVLIPPGSFWMGCNAAVDIDCRSNETPYHEVTLSGYYIDKTELTVAAYKDCVDAGICTVPRTDDIRYNWGVSGREKHPINGINYSQASAYCAWQGRRLPSEAEWEKAARGTDGRKYPWGNETATCDYAVMGDGSGYGCGTDRTMPVCSKSPAGDSPYGLCDMSGNVWEWVSDWYDSAYYSSSPGTDPVGPESGSYRVLRGGSFDAGYYYLGASYRVVHYPSGTGVNLGVRCARDAL